MKINSYIILSVLLLAAASCRSTEEELLFDQTADERVAQATADLRQKLAAPANGWVMRYQPVPESGAYNVLLNFDADGGVRIRTDFGVNDNEFYDQLNTYRIDNSLGLELVFETYSFFSYLFEQDGATFEAEYEFDFVNETPDGALVFSSKTDLTALTIAVLEPAPDNPETLLGQALNTDLEGLFQSLGTVSPVYRLNYTNRDLSLYLSLNTSLRTLNFSYATSLSGERGQAINTFTTGYLVQGNSLILNEPLTGNFVGSEIAISAINFSDLTDGGTVDACGQPITIQQYQGQVADSNDPVVLLPALFNPSGATFDESANLFRSPLGLIYDNGTSVGQQIIDDIPEARQLQLYYIDNVEDPFIAIGFLLINENGSATFALKDFTLERTDNRVAFDFAQDYTLYNDTTATVNVEALDTYVNKIAEGGETYVLRSGDDRYEFYNVCNGWSFVFFGEQL